MKIEQIIKILKVAIVSKIVALIIFFKKNIKKWHKCLTMHRVMCYKWNIAECLGSGYLEHKEQTKYLAISHQMKVC